MNIKNTIKNFFKPTLIKIGLTILILIGIYPLISYFNINAISKEISCLLVPQTCIALSCLNKMCLHQKLFITLFGQTSDPEDMELMSVLFFVAPLGIIYYYLLSCGFVCIFKKKKEK